MKPITDIIHVSDVKAYYQVSENIDRAQIERAINDAFNIDLPRLGFCPKWLRAMREASNDEWADVLDEKSWNDNYHVGLRYIVATFAYARYLLEKAGTDTPFGFVEKTAEWSREVEQTKKMNFVKELRLKAKQLAGNLLEYAIQMNAHNFNGLCKQVRWPVPKFDIIKK